MKKMASLIWVPLLLGSCFTVNHKKNYFVAGQFEATVDEVGYYLKVEEISKSVFSSSSGINTVEDAVTGKYFSVLFSECAGEQTASIDLVDLRDENPRTKAIPACYVDDNGVSMTPLGGVESLDEYYYVAYKQTSLSFTKKGVKHGFTFAGA